MEEKNQSGRLPSRENDVFRAPGEYASQSLHLELEIRDPEVIKEITAYPEGRNRLEFAQTCLKIGVLALKQAEGQIDAYAVRNEGEKLLTSMQHQLENHRQTVTEQVSTTLREYFDPNSGRFQERYRAGATPEELDENEHLVRSRLIFDYYGWPDLSAPYWQAVSLTGNIDYLSRPIQIHHAEDDPVVSVNYSYGLAGTLQEAGKPYEFYTYEGGGHNLVSPYFDQAMLRTVEFFLDNL